MARTARSVWAILVSALMLLAACEDVTRQFDPLSVSGREGATPLTYEAVMRVATAAHAGGDLGNAVGLYRRAAVLQPLVAAPFVAAGNTLMEMGQVDEAMIAYRSALDRQPRDPEALRGLAKAYLKTSRPELAGGPLQIAYEDSPNDPKLLQLVGVTDDLLGQHREAQARYRRGLELAPADRGLRVNLALSLGLTGNYEEAISLLGPLATGPGSTPRERQTLALIYGLKGDRAAAERLGKLDVEQSAVVTNLEYYERLKRSSAEARTELVRSLVGSSSAPTEVKP